MVTNTVSVDYLTKPLQVFQEVGRVLRPGPFGINDATMGSAFLLLGVFPFFHYIPGEGLHISRYPHMKPGRILLRKWVHIFPSYQVTDSDKMVAFGLVLYGLFRSRLYLSCHHFWCDSDAWYFFSASNCFNWQCFYSLNDFKSSLEMIVKNHHVMCEVQKNKGEFHLHHLAPI